LQGTLSRMGLFRTHLRRTERFGIAFTAFTLSIDTLRNKNGASHLTASISSCFYNPSPLRPLLQPTYSSFSLIQFNHLQQSISLYNFNMTSPAHAQFDALRALFGNNHPVIVQARLDFFRSISDEDLHEIHQICLDQHVSRAAHQTAITASFETAANEAKAESHHSSGSAAPAIPIGERTSIKRKRSEADEQRRESFLGFREKTPAQHHGHVFDLGSLGAIDDDLRGLMQAVNETSIPNTNDQARKTEKRTP
jgi:hypothetical protein